MAEAKIEDILKRANQRALYLLQARDYTARQMRNKLKQAGYSEEIAEEVVTTMQEYRYIDDLRLSGAYIRSYADSRSRRRIEQDLLQKGVSKDVIQQAFTAWTEEGNAQDEQKMIADILRKKGYKKGEGGASEVGRMYRLLLRKGFSHEMVNKMIFSDSYFV